MQSWHDLLFAHWRMAPEQLRPLLPKSLTLDTFEGDAWIGITPFHMHLRPRGLPSVSHFPELNCRTYVEFGGKPGVFFFSLDAGSRLAVWGAKTFYLLPYFHAHIKIRKEGDRIRYISRRSSAAASLSANYAPSGPVRDSRRGTLEHWLTERYCLYAYSRQRLYRGEIHHVPWPLQNATCEIEENSIAAASGIALPQTSPLLHFARELDVLIWPLRAA